VAILGLTVKITIADSQGGIVALLELDPSNEQHKKSAANGNGRKFLVPIPVKQQRFISIM